MHAILILILSLSCFAESTVEEIVVTARPTVRTAKFKRLLERLQSCRIQKEDDCRTVYLDFQQYRTFEEERFRLTAAETKIVQAWENYAIDRLHQLDLDYNTMYLDEDVYGNEIDREGIKKESSQSELTPAGSGLYSAEEAQTRSALNARKSKASTNSGSLCEIPLDASGVNFVSQASLTGMPEAFITDALTLKKVDWLALENIPQTKQALVDAFINADENSKEFKQAQRELRSYFGINGKDEMRTESGPSKHAAMEYLKTARTRKIRVVAIGPDPAYANRGRRLDPLIAGTRNLVAANAIPTEGSGIVLSNWRDFHFPQNSKIQDFYAKRSQGALTLRDPTDRKCELTEAQTAACQTELTKYNSPAGCPNGNPFRCLRQKAAQLSGVCKQSLGSPPSIGSKETGIQPSRSGSGGSVR